MKLQRLRVEQLRQFREPFVLDNLQPGLNLIHGPNESGKSTLVRAIRAAFFERYRSKSVQDLSPWGDSGAAPTVDLQFEHQNTRWHLVKSFLKRTRCDLTVGNATFSEDDAEEQVAELLGYEYSKKGGSKAAHWGIPGLLWVEQGTGQEIEQSVEFAGDHLKSALTSLVGEVASSGGDAVIDKVAAERAVLLTKTGQPTGELRQVAEAREEQQAAVAQLQERVDHYQEQVDRLESVAEEHQRYQQERPWEAAQQQLDTAKRNLAEAERLEAEQRQESETLQRIEQQHQMASRALLQLQRADEQLAERDRERQQAGQALQAAESQGPGVVAELRAATQAFQAADGQLKAARMQENRSRLLRDQSRLAERQRSLTASLDKAREYQALVAAAREQAVRNRIETAAVAGLKNTERALREERIRSQAVATRLSWDLQPQAHLLLEDQALSGQGEQQLLDAARLVIPDIGTITVSPGGEDLAATRRKLVSLEQRFDSELAELGVGSVDLAEQRKAAFDAAERQRKHAEELLRSVAPSGVPALEAELADIVGELEALSQQIEALPKSDSEQQIAPLVEAEARLAHAETQLKAAEQRQRQHQSALLMAEQTRDAAQREWQRLHDDTHSDKRQAERAELQARLTQLQAEMTQKQGSLAERRVKIEQARPDILRQDIDRYQKTITHLQQAQEAREREIREARVRLEAWGAEGLEEQLNETRAAWEQSERRYQELSRRAKALDLLLTLLTEQRQELTRRLQAPLQKHLDHYVSLLFPQAKLEVDEQLQPGRFSRGTELGHVAELSFGAREQMGLISRLAYADLLREADRPTLIILDDTLVHSDQARLDNMKRILFDAANRHQILLFTCHPEKWQDLGVPPMDLQRLKQQGGVVV
ncbi:GTP-binding protein [Marinobacter fuscus]|uniref:GTP-binding protein n=1 Tax=Marinobacter fuscus TaxID=2109942 RepID=A0A2T1KPW0_9GAMM|nr:AAA family ATPase [Marinobacter fuscus]PSF12189.1 GTP-binding protein [Marinobacter fuscus]